jgi:D-aminopeptidase
MRKATVDFNEARIDALFADIDQCHLPGAVVGIAIGGKPVYRRGFGLANMELPVALSPSIRVRLGSTTKHFTSLAYMLLCEDGDASIDDPVGMHVADLNPIARQVTMRQLMTNTGGLRDVCDIRLQFSGIGGRPVPCAELLALYRDIDDVCAPAGTAWIYNNGGYLLLSAALEAISGQSLEELFRTRIFEPTGMHDTMVRRWDSDFVPNSASPHMRDSAGRFTRETWGLDFAGAGAVVSTIDDMLRWLAHMDNPVVGSKATWQLMKEPQKLINGTSTGYGFGLFNGLYRGVETLSHAGSWTGGNAQMMKVPAAGLDIAIMSNRHDVWGMLLANQILDACLPKLDASKTPASASFATGVFRSPRTARVVELFPKSGQQVVAIDGHDMFAQTCDDGVLRPITMYGYIKWTVTPLGSLDEAPEAITLSDFGNRDQLIREPRVEAPDANTIVGHYRSAMTGTEAAILETVKGPQLHTRGRFGSAVYDLECIAAGVWRARQQGTIPWGGLALFDRDKGDFRFTSYGTRSLPFTRVA